MEGFTLSLALVDAIPVLLFGAGMILIASRFDSALFMTGAALSTLAGCCKVFWKLILGLKQKDIKWLNKCFVPMQSAGWLLILVSLVMNRNRIDWRGLLASVTSVPAVLFFLLWAVMTGVMVWYRKNRFQNDDTRSNWTAQIINCVCQGALLLGILFS